LISLNLIRGDTFIDGVRVGEVVCSLYFVRLTAGRVRLADSRLVSDECLEVDDHLLRGGYLTVLIVIAAGWGDTDNVEQV